MIFFFSVFQLMPRGQRADDMHGMGSGSMASQPGVTSSFSSAGFDEPDDYMDYMGGGGSPLGISSESSNQDRSCTSTPVGNDGSPAGESSKTLQCMHVELQYRISQLKHVIQVLYS